MLLVILAMTGTALAQEPPAMPPDANPAAAQAQPAPAAEEPAPPAENPDPRDEGELPTLDRMEVPSRETLLTGQPVDWIVIRNDKVIVTRPVYPRPDTLAKIDKAIEELRLQARNLSQEEYREKRQKLQKLAVFLPGDEEAFEIDRDTIQKILHHEDLLLMRADKLIEEEKFRDAFELIYLLKRKLPDWPGLDRRQNDLLFAEAGVKLQRDQPQAALVMLEELHGREANYQGLPDRLGQVAEALIVASVEASDFRRARHFLGRLEARAPNHQTTTKWREDFAARAGRLIADAQAASAGGRHDEAWELVRLASRVWPQASGLRPTFERAANRFQQLRVGVLELPAEGGSYFLPTQADLREQGLVKAELFEIERVGESPRYRTQFFEHWEPADLGREAVFTLRRSRRPWESRPMLTASDVAALVSRRLDAGSEGYDERLDSYIHSFTVQSPYQFHVRFDRVPLRTEMVLAMPVVSPPEEATSSDVSTAPTAVPPLTKGGLGGVAQVVSAPPPAEPPPAPPLVRGGESAGAKGGDSAAGDQPAQRFRVHRRTQDEIAWRRSYPQPDGLSEYHLTEIVETRYSSGEQAVQGLLRGEIDMLPELRHRWIDPLAEDGRFFVVKFALPSTHILQFNPRSKPLQQRELRRALVYALDRERILHETVLGGADSRFGRLTSAAWATTSYAYNPLVKPRRHDLAQAFALALAGKKALGDALPDLRLVCPPDETARRAAERIVAAWEQIGVKASILSPDAPAPRVDSEDWDIVYRRARMEEPISGLWPFLTLNDKARVELLTHLPDWLRQKLIALDDETAWNEAVVAIKELHQDLWGEAMWIPLWEVDQYLAIRNNMRGLSPSPMHAYQGAEGWYVERPWYPTETP
ncbi:MAG: hypothetical protein KY476_06650 [Planctomycetes bacterium]|nr:hypothetical protein [Planctomycetota bacterium]